MIFCKNIIIGQEKIEYPKQLKPIEMSEEQPTKKQKQDNDWSGHTLNISEAIMKDSEGKNLVDLVDAELQVLQGIGPKAEEILESLGLKTVRDLAEYKFYKIAKSIKVLATVESSRPTNSVMNVDKAVTLDFEKKTLKEIVDAPIHALQGLTTKADEVLKSLGVKTIGDLAELKYAAWAEAIVDLSTFEETKTRTEKKLDKLK